MENEKTDTNVIFKTFGQNIRKARLLIRKEVSFI